MGTFFLYPSLHFLGSSLIVPKGFSNALGGLIVSPMLGSGFLQWSDVARGQVHSLQPPYISEGWPL